MAYKTSVQQEKDIHVTARQCVGHSRVMCVKRVKGDFNCKLYNALHSGEMDLWSTLVKTNVNAVNISRQQNLADCRQGYEPTVLNIRMKGNHL